MKNGIYMNLDTNTPILMYGDIKHWFCRFYYGEYGEMILNRILNFYKYFREQSGGKESCVINRPNFNDGIYWNYMCEHIPAVVDLYHLMADFGHERIELPTLNIEEIEEFSKLECCKRRF